MPAFRWVLLIHLLQNGFMFSSTAAVAYPTIRNQAPVTNLSTCTKTVKSCSNFKSLLIVSQNRLIFTYAIALARRKADDTNLINSELVSLLMTSSTNVKH